MIVIENKMVVRVQQEKDLVTPKVLCYLLHQVHNHDGALHSVGAKDGIPTFHKYTIGEI